MKTKNQIEVMPRLETADYLLSGQEAQFSSEQTLASGGTRCTVQLLRIFVLEDNESGDDEWRFEVYLGENRTLFQFPNANRQLIVPKSVRYPYTYEVNTRLFDGILAVTTGQTVGLSLEVVAKEIDTFSDDVSRAIGAVGLVVPTRMYYNLVTIGDTPVQFQFFVTAEPYAKAPM